jgi:photosystem II stability/assembly factor-like uncharacterized protein
MNSMSLKTSILIISTFILTFSEVPAQWMQINSGTTNSLQSVHFADNNNGYVVGEAGLILKSTDGGLTWQNVSAPGSTTYYDVFVFNQNEAVVVGGGGMIVRTTNGGTNWNTVPSGVTDELFSVSFLGSNGICGGSSQTILYSTNSGASWNTAQSGFFGGGFWGAVMLDTQTGFVAGSNSIFQPMLGKTTNSGVNWDFTPFYLNSNEGRATGVDFTDANTGYVSSAVWDGRGAISKTTNAGNDWVTFFSLNILEDIDFPISGASLTGYAVGQSGTILKTNNAGSPWQQQISGTSQTLNKVFFIDIDNGFIAGDGGIILKTNNGGIPVELVSFSAKVHERNVILNWTTASEINNKGFEIERKFIGNQSSVIGDWEWIGFVEGNGTTTELKTYLFNDNDMPSGEYAYRLKQIDFDGSFEYSNEVEVEINLPSVFNLEQNYPNPFNPVTIISWQLPVSSKVTIKVYDIIGQQVATLVNGNFDPGIHNIQFSADGLNSGIYFYSFEARGVDGSKFISTRKMMVIK